VTAAQMNDTSEAGAQKVALEEAQRAERRVRNFKGLPHHRTLHLPGLGSRPTSRSCSQRLAACWHVSVGVDQWLRLCGNPAFAARCKIECYHMHVRHAMVDQDACAALVDGDA